MKVGLLSAALAATTLGLAGAASAQTVTGTVTVTGSVASKCSVNPGGGSTFSDTFALGELAEADGTLRTIVEQVTSGTWNIRCTSIPDVSIAATNLESATPSPGVGYTNSITYSAHADFDLVGAGSDTISVVSDTGPTLPVALSAHLQNTPGNVVIRANTFVDSGDTLVAAPDYEGVITVTITPS